MPFRVGEPVTILPPYTDDSVIIEHQHHGRVAGRADAGYYVAIADTFPPNERFGPFPERRLARGWKDGNGRWRP
jgi:hypothetical protein